MDTTETLPFTLHTALTGYLPLPRAALGLGLPSTALLLYAALVDRATLSQKNRYADAAGRVYVIYPIESLGSALGLSRTAVKSHLAALERAGLISRQRPAKNGPNHLFVFLPRSSAGGDGAEPMPPAGGFPAPEGRESAPPGGGKLAPNNRNTNNRKRNNSYYQHGEDESL